ncbi:AAA domain-containing protein [Nonomuraea terrae]|uniref:AAA domain-containing protein n=1 Tax=Nonomuraea terrae TaxID=2530383 RepID=UPI0037A0738E
MDSGQKPSWLTAAVTAVQELWASCAEDRPSDRPRQVGPAYAATGRDRGWFTVVLRQPLDLDKAEAVFLTSGQGHATRYSVFETFSDQGLLYLRVMESAPTENMVLCVQQAASSTLVRSLTEHLRELSPSPLTSAFATGRLSPMPPTREHGLNAEQNQAVSACCAAGLHAIWGPPGTGKTRVIAHALRALRAAGKSVLLVSGTNVAVDNALQRAAELATDLLPGQFVRVGAPTVRAVAEDERLALAQLVRGSLEQVERERLAIADRIDDTRADPRLAAAREAGEHLRGFDPVAHAAATARIAASADKQQHLERCERARTHRDQARRHCEKLDELVRQAESAWLEREADRRLHAEAARLRTELDDYHRTADRASLRLASQDDALRDLQDRLGEQETWSRWKRMRRATELKALRTEADQAERALADSRQRLGQIRDALARYAPDLRQRIAACEQAASCSQAEIARHDAERTMLRRQAATAQRSYQQAQATLGRAEHALNALPDVPEPTPEDLALAQHADDTGLPTLHARLRELEQAAHEPMQQLILLEQQHEKVLARRRRLERDAEQELINSAQVVATTHAMLRMRPAVHRRSYDHVLIDEASACYPAEVLYALSRATHGASLLGDFMQNGPIVDLPEPHSPDVTTWLARDAFTALGIDGRHPVPGCVTLSTQYRFGPAINELANRLAYGGRLVVGRPIADEIVLIDTSGLPPELVSVRRDSGSPCWAVGPLLARALAEHHLAGGETSVGVITPYRDELDLITDVFTDTDVDARVEAGTIYRFQGREFDTAIVDLVEDGWSRIARNMPGARRTVNVAVTRARQLLYLIAPGAVVARAGSGPLRILGDLCRERRVTIVSARDLLGLEHAPEPSGARRTVWEALHSHVKVTGLYDEELLPAELCAAIDAAEQSVWMWSPWVGQRVFDILPALKAAARRGVIVRAVVLPPREKEERYEPYVEALRQAVQHVVFLRDEHQKLAVIDGSLTFIGSMNMLSHQRVGGRREVMAVMRSRHFAAHILRHERADEFARPPICPTCSQQREAALRGSGAKRRLHWLCPPPCRHPQTAFPDIDGGRNQRRAPRRPRR